jgi:hypothetical protein
MPAACYDLAAERSKELGRCVQERDLRRGGGGWMALSTVRNHPWLKRIIEWRVEEGGGCMAATAAAASKRVYSRWTFFFCLRTLTQPSANLHRRRQLSNRTRSMRFALSLQLDVRETWVRMQDGQHK